MYFEVQQQFVGILFIKLQDWEWRRQILTLYKLSFQFKIVIEKLLVGCLLFQLICNAVIDPAMLLIYCSADVISMNIHELS